MTMSLFVKSDAKYFAVKTIGGYNEYYQVVVVGSSQTITQPTLSSNGVWGGDSFACREEMYYSDPIEPPQQFYCLFGSPYEWQINEVDLNKFYWGKFYNPNPLLIQSLSLQNSTGMYAPSQIKFYGSHDDATYELLVDQVWDTTEGKVVPVNLPSDMKPYKYFKLEVKPSSTVSVMLLEMQFNAIEFLQRS